MKKMKFLSLAFILFALTFTLSSSLPTEKANDDAVIKKTNLNSTEKVVSKNDKTFSYKEMKKMAETTKGSKLSFKEKLGLKLFNKKFSSAAKTGDGSKSQVVALILVLLVGLLGIHRFYLGYTWQGIVQLLTLGFCGIWTLIDLIRIITGDLTPKDGSYGTTL